PPFHPEGPAYASLCPHPPWTRHHLRCPRRTSHHYGTVEQACRLRGLREGRVRRENLCRNPRNQRLVVQKAQNERAKRQMRINHPWRLRDDERRLLTRDGNI